MARRCDRLCYLLLLEAVVTSEYIGARDITIQPFHEERLERHLLVRLGNHSRLVAPRTDKETHITVQMDLELIRAELVEAKGVFFTEVKAKYRWTNAHLVWRPARFGGVRHIILPASSMWIPHIDHLNQASAGSAIRDQLASSVVMVHHDGHVTVALLTTLRSLCTQDMTEYPFDVHNCSMSFQAAPGQRFRLQLMSPGSAFQIVYDAGTEGRWALNANDSKQLINGRPDASGAAPLTFTLTLRRQTGFMGYFVLGPCLFLVSVSLVAFCLPPERPDRIALVCSFVSCFAVVMLAVIQVAPPTRACVPKIEILYSTNMTLVILIIPLSAFVGRLRKRRGKMSRLIKVVFVQGIGSCLFACMPPVGVISSPAPTDAETAKPQSADDLVVRERSREDSSPHNVYYTNLVDRGFKLIRSVSSRRRKHSVRRLSDEVRHFSDWMLLGVVLDRILIFLYVIFIIVLAYLFLPRSY